jgi:hypothetical protein
MESTGATATPDWKGKVVLALAAVLVIALLFYRLRAGSFQWQLFLDTLYHVNWIWLALSILLMLLTYWGRALRWEVMLRPLGRTLSIRKLTYDTAIGFTAIVLLGRAGEVVRPYLISVSTGVPFSSQVAAWMLERILDLLAVLLLFGFALLWIPSRGLALGPALRWVLGAGGYLIAGIGVACLLFLIVFRNFSDAGGRRILSAVTFLPENYYKRVEKMLKAFSEGMESTRDSWSLLLLLVYTALEWLLIVGAYYALFRSFPVTSTFNFTDVVIILGFLAFGSIVQLPGIGGGIQVVTFVVVVPVGFVCALHEGLNWKKLKALPKDVSL